MADRTFSPASRAAATTGAKRSMLSSMLQLMLRWLKAWVAAPNTTTSSGRVAAPPASAACSPSMLGTSTL